MPIQGASIPLGATVTPSGGTALVLTSDGQTVANGVHLIDAADTNFKTRRNAVAKVKQPTLSADRKSYSKGKKSFTFVLPITDTAGVIQFPLVRVEIEDHPDMSAANLASLKSAGALCLIDSDFDAFWSSGSLA